MRSFSLFMSINLSINIGTYYKGGPVETLCVLDRLLKIIIFCYIIIVQLFFIFSHFQTIYFSTKSIYSIASSIQKKTSQERRNETNPYNSFKLENCNPSTVSVLHFAILHLFQKFKKNTFKGTAHLQSRGIDAPNQVLKLTNIWGKVYKILIWACYR